MFATDPQFDYLSRRLSLSSRSKGERRRSFIQKVYRRAHAFAGRHVQGAHFDLRVTEDHARLNFPTAILRRSRTIRLRIPVVEHIQHQRTYKENHQQARP